MKREQKLSLSFRILKFFGLNFSESEYGQVSFGEILIRVIVRFRNAFLLKYCQNLIIFSPINARSIRPKIWSLVGCKVGKGVFIGKDVFLDSSNSEFIELEDGVHIAARSILLCHQRDMNEYFVGSKYGSLPYVRKKITLKKGCLIGTQSMVMPGVTVGEGAIIGSFSLVNKDIPAWTVAIGIPAKIVKNIPEKTSNETISKPS